MNIRLLMVELLDLLDTATFELFRTACSIFYSEFPSNEGSVQLDRSEDKAGKDTVQHTYKVKRDPATKKRLYREYLPNKQ